MAHRVEFCEFAYSVGHFGKTRDLREGEIVFLITNGMIMDLVIFGGINKKAVYIISPKWKEIKDALLNDIDRGVTGINVIGEYSNENKKMLANKKPLCYII